MQEGPTIFSKRTTLYWILKRHEIWLVLCHRHNRTRLRSSIANAAKRQLNVPAFLISNKMCHTASLPSSQMTKLTWVPELELDDVHTSCDEKVVWWSSQSFWAENIITNNNIGLCSGSICKTSWVAQLAGWDLRLVLWWMMQAAVRLKGPVVLSHGTSLNFPGMTGSASYIILWTYFAKWLCLGWETRAPANAKSPSEFQKGRHYAVFPDERKHST